MARPEMWDEDGKINIDRVMWDIAWLDNRCEQARAVDGVSQEEVLDNVKTVPPGWVLDFASNYWVPPNFHFSEQEQPS